MYIDTNIQPQKMYIIFKLLGSHSATWFKNFFYGIYFIVGYLLFYFKYVKFFLKKK